ncbi:MAG: sarcosine oxidase subunit gamma [Roseobacter sp.]
MVELVATSPGEALLPISIAALSLAEIDLGPLTSIAPFAGQDEAVSIALETAHGVGFPAPNRAVSQGKAKLIWFARKTALLVGVSPDRGLAQHAALTDQSDAWLCVQLSGLGAEDVMARLTPVDLRPAVFAHGHTCRTLIGHMSASITRLAPDSLLILVFRSMAVTLVEELQEAMEAVTARG